MPENMGMITIIITTMTPAITMNTNLVMTTAMDRRR